jgi:Cu2+-exporting ATPase
MSGAIGKLARQGVLVARGRAIEALAKATHFVFDKTGTLTEGKLQVVGVFSVRDNDEAAALRLAAGIGGASLHPVAKALARAAANAAIVPESGNWSVKEVAGQGLEARHGDDVVRFGNTAFVQQLHGQSANIPSLYTDKTLAALGDARGWIAIFALEDTLRADAKACIDFLRHHGKQVLLLSGDKTEVVDKIASELGISHAQGDLRPQQKHDVVKALQEQGAIVAMIGDGMNDGPVLSLADVSIAMGQGAPISQARSDLVLLSSRLQDLQAAVKVTAKSMTLIRENLGWAILYNVVAIPAAAAGLLAPWHAAIGMSVSSLIVVLNSLRVLKG